jgi:HEAT repeat protein
VKYFLLCGFCLVLCASCANRVDARINRAYALARHPSDRNKNRIEALLHDDDRDVRATALILMASLDKERSTRMAQEALTDPDGLVRAAAVMAVGPEADAATLKTLADLAVSDPVWQVRARALEAIPPSDDPAVRELFARALSDSVRHVRRAALRAGAGHPGLLPGDRVSELVVSDPDWENRVDAALALGAWKDPGAYAGLDAAIADPNEFVRATAEQQRRGLERAGVAR